jgi:TRAP transporter TAXI family solute receptor
MTNRQTAWKRWTLLAPLAGFGVLGGLLLAGGLGAADTPPGRIPFQIATGSAAGAFFQVGEAIAGLISHPEGVDRCGPPGVCGPPGLIITASTSAGTVDNVMAVNSGTAESGLARADVVAAAVRGEGAFRRSGKASHVRTIASLFSEDVQLIVAARSRIKSVADLRGKRISFGAGSAGMAFTGRQILAAYRVPETNLKIVDADLTTALGLLQAGKLDAIFTVGAVPLNQVTGFLAGGQGRLVPIDGPGRDRLVQMIPQFAGVRIAAGSYPGQSAVDTVSTQAVWIVRDSLPDPLIYGITRALFDPANHDGLVDSHPSAREIGLATAALNPPAPLHSGAARFYRGKGVLPASK